MKYEDFLDKLDGVKGSGTEHTALCPGHDDNQNSLSVGYDKQKRAILIKCHAGCDTGAVLGAMGLTFKDLYEGTLKTKTKARSQLGPIVQTYNYIDEDGALLFQVTRHEPKTFRQRRPDGAGGWTWSLNGTRRVLYNLPAVASCADDWVYVVEGEKDADRLISLGICATTSSGGAGNSKHTDWTILEGRRVAIIPDNDKSGGGYAEEVAQSVREIATEIRIVKLPGLGDKEDVSDWLDAGNTAADLRLLLDETEEWIAEEPSPPPADDNFLIGEPLDDYGNSNCVYRLHGDRFRYTGQFEWLEWTGTHWRPGDVAEAHARLAVRDTLLMRRVAIVGADTDGNQSTSAVRPNTSKITAALTQFRDLVTVDGASFDDVPHLLNCANGVVDLRTGEMVSHDPSSHFTYCIPTDYEPGAPADLWESTLMSVLENDAERVAYIKRALGYSATGETREECLFYLSGKNGRNGKGTIVNTVLDVLGMPLAQATSFSSFSGRYNDPQGFLLAPLHNARMVAASESSKSVSLNEATVKMVTGRDSFQVAFKGKTPFMMTPAFKVWLMSNHPIRGDTDDNAFWYRFRLIEFNRTFQGHEDKLLKNNLLQADSRRGILAWLVHGAMQWYDRGLGEPKSIFEAVQRHRDEQDDALRFITEALKRPKDGGAKGVGVSLDDVYQVYKIWADDNGVKPWSKAYLSRKLRAKDVDIQRQGRHPDQYQRVMGYVFQDEYRAKVVSTT